MSGVCDSELLIWGRIHRAVRLKRLTLENSMWVADMRLRQLHNAAIARLEISQQAGARAQGLQVCLPPDPAYPE